MVLHAKPLLVKKQNFNPEDGETSQEGTPAVSFEWNPPVDTHGVKVTPRLSKIHLSFLAKRLTDIQPGTLGRQQETPQYYPMTD